MTITLLSQDTPGAPSVTGASGTLIAVLDFCLVTNLGWEKVFSGTNVATYRAPTGNRFYLGVSETATLNARLRCFETATAAGTAVASGTGPTPTDAQLSGGCYIYKSNDTSTVRTWRFASNGKLFHLAVGHSTPSGASSYRGLFSFGDFVSYKAADAYNTLIHGENTATGYTTATTTVNTFAGSITGSYLVRAYTQLGGSSLSGKVVSGIYSSTTSFQFGAAGVSYPSAIEGGLLIERLQITDNNNSVNPGIRGYMPGLWAPMHTRPLQDLNTFTGTGDFAGRTFVVWDVGIGQVFIETSDTWET